MKKRFDFVAATLDKFKSERVENFSRKDYQKCEAQVSDSDFLQHLSCKNQTGRRSHTVPWAGKCIQQWGSVAVGVLEVDGSVETSFWQDNFAAKKQLQQTFTDLRSEQCRYFGIMSDVSCRLF